MAEDLVKRLRWPGIHGADDHPVSVKLRVEAADLIERLDRAAEVAGAEWAYGPLVRDAKATIDQQAASLAAKDAEIETLRALRAADPRTSLLTVIADIREKVGVGGKPMLSELAGAIAEKIAAAESRAVEAEKEHTDMMWQRRRADDRAEQAERALAETRAHLAMRNSDLDESQRALAEAVEVMRPLVNLIDQIRPALAEHATMRAARAFIQQHQPEVSK